MFFQKGFQFCILMLLGAKHVWRWEGKARTSVIASHVLAGPATTSRSSLYWCRRKVTFKIVAHFTNWKVLISKENQPQSFPQQVVPERWAGKQAGTWFSMSGDVFQGAMVCLISYWNRNTFIGDEAIWMSDFALLHFSPSKNGWLLDHSQKFNRHGLGWSKWTLSYVLVPVRVCISLFMSFFASRAMT